MTGPAQVFAEMKRAMPSLDNITWDRLEARDRSVTYPCPAPGHPGHGGGVRGRRVPDRGRPRQAGPGRRSSRRPSSPTPTYPWVLTTGRTLEHWHTGAMTRRASNLDALEPEAVRHGQLARPAPHGRRPPATRSGSPPAAGAIELMARQDNAVPEGVLFIPFCFVEAAANILTNPQLDPFGKIPEFKYCAARSGAAGGAGRRGVGRRWRPSATSTRATSSPGPGTRRASSSASRPCTSTPSWTSTISWRRCGTWAATSVTPAGARSSGSWSTS